MRREKGGVESPKGDRGGRRMTRSEEDWFTTDEDQSEVPRTGEGEWRFARDRARERRRK